MKKTVIITEESLINDILINRTNIRDKEVKVLETKVICCNPVFIEVLYDISDKKN